MKGRNKELSDKAADERRRCSDWLLPFMQNGQPKFATKTELRDVAMRELTCQRVLSISDGSTPSNG